MKNALFIAGLFGLLLFSDRVSMAGINGVKKYSSRWFYPYKYQEGKYTPAWRGDWKTNLSGVYQIRNATTKEIVYVGSAVSGGLKKTIYRHFQNWTDRQRDGRYFDRTVYDKNNYQVKFITCTPTDAARIEKYLIRKLKPSGNPLKYLNLNEKQIELNKTSAAKFKESYSEINLTDLPW